MSGPSASRVERREPRPAEPGARQDRRSGEQGEPRAPRDDGGEHGQGRGQRFADRGSEQPGDQRCEHQMPGVAPDGGERDPHTRTRSRSAAIRPGPMPGTRSSSSDGGEAAVLRAVIEDLLRGRGADAGRCVELLQRRGVEVHGLAGRGGCIGATSGRRGRGCASGWRTGRDQHLLAVLELGGEVDGGEVGAPARPACAPDGVIDACAGVEAIDARLPHRTCDVNRHAPAARAVDPHRGRRDQPGAGCAPRRVADVARADQRKGDRGGGVDDELRSGDAAIHATNLGGKRAHGTRELQRISARSVPALARRPQATSPPARSDRP